jgi:quinol monooxygenase YgiN
VKEERMSRYRLYGKFTAHPGQRDALLDLLLQSAALVRETAGCEVWIVNASPDDPDSIVIYEAWRSEADHDASLTHDEIRAVIARARPLIAVIEGTKLTPLAGKGLADDAS